MQKHHKTITLALAVFWLFGMAAYSGSAGHVSQEAVKRYIQEQEGKEIFEYSVFGSPNQKIGDFTQTKLGGFNA